MIKNQKLLKLILIPALGVLPIGAITPIVTSCGKPQLTKAQGMKLDIHELKLSTVESDRLIPIFFPENAIEMKVTWQSSKPEVATVDEEGFVEAIAPGKTIITATTEDGKFSDKCEVEIVYKPIEDIHVFPIVITLITNESGCFYPVVYPNNASNKKVIWQSSNPEVASIDENGKVTALIAGRTTITATTEDRNEYGSQRSTTCTVVVINSGEEEDSQSL